MAMQQEHTLKLPQVNRMCRSSTWGTGRYASCSLPSSAACGSLVALLLSFGLLFPNRAAAQQCDQFTANTGSTDPANPPLSLIFNVANLPAPMPYTSPIGITGSFYDFSTNSALVVGGRTLTTVPLNLVQIYVYNTPPGVEVAITMGGVSATPTYTAYTAVINLTIDSAASFPNATFPAVLPPLSAFSKTVFDVSLSGGSTNVNMASVDSIGSSCTNAGPPVPSITPGGIVPVYSTSTTIEPGEWVSLFGTNLASSTATWTGNFPTSLGGTSVKINGKSAYLWFVSPTQINLQAPDDTATGPVPVVVTTANGVTATATVTLAQFAPAFLLLDTKHITGIILRSNGTGAYGGGTYDIVGPTGTSLGYATVAAKAGDSLELFGVGFGPTNPVVPAGQAYSGAAATTSLVTLLINNVSVTPSFAGLSSAGLYQINLTVPAGLGTGDVPLVAMVGGVQTQTGVVLSLQ
jgi:uncharacterized protein (TIGR03437 family)